MWLVVIPNLDCFLGVLGVMGIISSVFGGFVYIDKKIDAYDQKDHEDAWKFAKTIIKLFAASMFMFFITCFIPTKKDIFQLKIISVVSELKGVDQIPQKLIDRLNDLLDGDKKDE